jgi:hypothetical protein
MMFQGRSVISAVWGVVPTPASHQQVGQPVWSVLRLFRRHAQQRPAGSPRLPVSGSSPNPPTGPR